MAVVLSQALNRTVDPEDAEQALRGEKATEDLLSRLENDDKERPITDFLCVTPFVSAHKNHHVLLEYGATGQDHMVTVAFGIAATNIGKHSFRPCYIKDLNFYLTWPGSRGTISWSKPERRATTVDVTVKNGMGRVPVHYDDGTKSSKDMTIGDAPPPGRQIGTLDVRGTLLVESDMWSGTRELTFTGVVSIPVMFTYTEQVLIAADRIRRALAESRIGVASIAPVFKDGAYHWSVLTHKEELCRLDLDYQATQSDVCSSASIETAVRRVRARLA